MQYYLFIIKTKDGFTHGIIQSKDIVAAKNTLVADHGVLGEIMSVFQTDAPICRVA